VKIKNETHWNTAHLRAFITRVAQEETEPARRKHLAVAVSYGGRSTGVSGRAACPGYWAKIFVSSVTIDRQDLAHTIRHELAHTRGLGHALMRDSVRYRRVGEWRELEAWALALPLDKVTPKARPTLDERRAKKLVHAERMLSRWEHKAKTAAQRVKRWRGRVKDYTRYIQMAATSKGGAS